MFKPSVMGPSVNSFLKPSALWIAAPLVLIFALTAHGRLGIDTWWIIALGKLISESWRLPDTYPLAFGPQIQGYVDSQWLAQIVFYAPIPLFGVEGVSVLN